MRRSIGIVFTVLFVFSIAGFSADDDWKVYLNSSAIYRIRCLGDSLWCSTSGGVLLFDLSDSTFTHYYNGLDFPSTDVRDVAMDGNGSLWVAFSTQGIIRIADVDTDPKTTRYDELHSELLSDSITCLLAVGDGIYYGSSAGVAKIQDDTHILVPELTAGLAGRMINDLFERPDTLWVACDDGAALFDTGSGDFSFFSLGRVTSFCDYGGFIYCAGDTGTAKFAGGEWQPVGSLDFTPVSIASGGGEMVCATDERVYQWNGLDWVSLDATGMKTLFDLLYRMRWRNILRTVAVDERGIPWVGGVYAAQNRGVYVNRYEGGAWFNEASEQLSHNRIVELAAGDDGGVWTSTNVFGIGYLTEGDRWTLYTRYRQQWGDEALSFLENNLAVLFDAQGYLWCNALDFDLDRIRINDPLSLADDEWDHYAVGEGSITSNRFVKAKEDPAGNRWFLSDDANSGEGMWGINIRRADQEEEWLSINPSIESRMRGGSIFDCVFDVLGRVYLAIRGYGVQRWGPNGFDWPHLTNLEDDVWEDIIRDDQLTSTIIHSIERDSNGRIYLGTSGGIVRYLQGSIDSIAMKTSFTDEGLLGSIVYDLEMDGAGNMWVATEGGLNRIDREGTIAAFTTAEHWESELQFIYSTSVIAPLPNHICRALQYDPVADVLWIGTDNGLVRLDVSAPLPEMIRLSDLVLYPNPVNISRGDNALRIGRISEPVSVGIYTVEGELVHEVSGLGEGDVAWDLLTINGFKARSGVYIVRIQSRSGSEIRKIAVVR